MSCRRYGNIAFAPSRITGFRLLLDPRQVFVSLCAATANIARTFNSRRPADREILKTSQSFLVMRRGSGSCIYEREAPPLPRNPARNFELVPHRFELKILYLEIENWNIIYLVLLFFN